MRWLARWVNRLLDRTPGGRHRWPNMAGPDTDPPLVPGQIMLVTTVNENGLPHCGPCDTHHEPPVHYHRL